MRPLRLHSAPRSASGTSVVLPAPGGATSTALPRARRTSSSAGSTAVTGRSGSLFKVMAIGLSAPEYQQPDGNDNVPALPWGQSTMPNTRSADIRLTGGRGRSALNHCLPRHEQAPRRALPSRCAKLQSRVRSDPSHCRRAGGGAAGGETVSGRASSPQPPPSLDPARALHAGPAFPSSREAQPYPGNALPYAACASLSPGIR